MFLKHAIPISLAITAILSIFMLQMGSDDETSIVLPLFALLVIPVGIWLADYRRKCLSEGWANVLILLAVLCHLGGLFQSASAFLAYSIANILVWIQLILFFRRKDVAICYHLLTLSFLQGGVACVFQQSELFFPLLLAFSFSVLCSLSLLFLNQERYYYRGHVFLKRAFDSGEKVKRVTVGHLFVLAVKTLFITPLIILWGYRWKELTGDDAVSDDFYLDAADGGAKRMDGKRKKTWARIGGRMAGEEGTGGDADDGLDDDDLAAEGRNRIGTFYRLWERAALVSSAEDDGSDFLPEAELPDNQTGGETRQTGGETGRTGGETRQTGGEAGRTRNRGEAFDGAGRAFSFFSFRSRRRLAGGKQENKTLAESNGANRSPLRTKSMVLAPENVSKNGAKNGAGSRPADVVRCPALRQIPLFSGMSDTGGRFVVDRHLMSRLMVGGALSLGIAMVLFLFFPRFNNVEIGALSFAHDQWRGATPAVRSVVGFNENLKLGEIGPLGDNHESVMTIRLTEIPNHLLGTTPNPSDLNPVDDGERVYLRGTVLVRYNDRQWFRPERNENLWLVPLSLMNPNKPDYRRRSYWEPGRRDRVPGHLFFESAEEVERGIYDTRNILVREDIRIAPMSTPVLFTVWPFFQSRTGFGLMGEERFFRTAQDAARESSFSLYTNAFRDGRQVDLIPAQEYLLTTNLDELRSIDESRLPELVALARKWDAESNLPKADYIGRAKNLEGQFRDSGLFAYSREGVGRNSDLDPLEDFVSLHREGHCEYFAGALAMMLRAIGIPSRIIVGFCFLSESGSGGTTTVRQSDAHTWVEAYIPRENLPKEEMASAPPEKEVEGLTPPPPWWGQGGWLRLDATPEQSGELIRSVSITWQSWRDFFRGFWADYVMNFSGGRQLESIYRPTAEVLGRFWRGLTALVGRISPFRSGIEEAKTDRTGSGSAFRLLVILQNLVAVVLLSALVWGGIRLVRRLGRRRLMEAGNLFKTRRSAAGFLFRLEKFLKRFGIVRAASETPRELVDRFFVSAEGVAFKDRWSKAFGEPEAEGDEKKGEESLSSDVFLTLSALVEAGYRVRFGGGTLAEEENRRFESFFRRAENFSSGR